MLGRPIVRFDAVSSTMTVLADLAVGGAREGTTVVAGYQSAGRGRLNRTWDAPPDSALLASVLLRPQVFYSRVTALSMLVADAIATSVEDLYRLQATIKWPNDVLIDGLKLSGILIRTRMQPEGMVVVVGFGINANIPPDLLPSTGTSLLAHIGLPVDINVLLYSVLAEIEIRYEEFVEDDLHLRWEDIQSRLAMRGDEVVVRERDSAITGVLKRVDDDGALVLNIAGSDHRIVVGDVTRGPKSMFSTKS